MYSLIYLFFFKPDCNDIHSHYSIKAEVTATLIEHALDIKINRRSGIMENRHK